MTNYKVENVSNYPKTVGGVELRPGESGELDLTEEQVEEALRGLEFEKLEEDEEESMETQEGQGQETKPEEESENEGDQ